MNYTFDAHNQTQIEYSAIKRFDHLISVNNCLNKSYIDKTDKVSLPTEINLTIIEIRT